MFLKRLFLGSQILIKVTEALQKRGKAEIENENLGF